MDAACREAAEELGVSIDPADLKALCAFSFEALPQPVVPHELAVLVQHSTPELRHPLRRGVQELIGNVALGEQILLLGHPRRPIPIDRPQGNHAVRPAAPETPKAGAPPGFRPSLRLPRP